MELFEKAYYEVVFENSFLKAKGTSFQHLFNKLMGLAYKDDYMPCCPWGSDGDQKNDGFLKSERLLFQVYAPNEMTKKEAIAKINEDFDGAKVYWKKYFDKWAFVHNAIQGIPPHVQERILNLEKTNPGIKLYIWGYEKLLEIFRQLQLEDLISWFGYAPNFETMNKLGFKDLKVVLESIAVREPQSNLPVKTVNPRKIEANQLSAPIVAILKHGISKSPLIKNFFSKWHDPVFGEKIAQAFRKKYAELRDDKELTPNKIFHEFTSWVGGPMRGTPEHEMAVYAVIAYFFENCDIYEEPRG